MDRAADADEGEGIQDVANVDGDEMDASGENVTLHAVHGRLCYM